MSEGGLSSGDVHSIVRGYVGPLENKVGRLQDHVQNLEAEMGHVADAVKGLHQSVDRGLGQIANSNKELVGISQTTQHITHEQFVATNAQLGVLNGTSATGFTKMIGGLGDANQKLGVVDGSIQMMTRALVQMEVIKLLNEAKGPLARMQSFGEEIDKRFAKAVENVLFVRSQYDQLLGNAMGEYDRKLRTIGEHIYAIYQDDFRACAELPLTTPLDTHLEFAFSVDTRRLEARSAALEANLAEIGENVLEPLLSAQKQFEHKLAGSYATRATGLSGEAALPVAVRLFETADEELLDVVAVAELVKTKGGDEGREGTRCKLVRAGHAVDVSDVVTRNQAALLDAMDTRDMTEPEVKDVKAALAEMASAGLIDQQLLDGYYDYLDTFGLEVIAAGEAEGK